MARSPAPSPRSRRSPWLWRATLLTALAAFAVAIVPIARLGTGAAVAYGVVVLLVLVSLSVLRAQHRRAESDVVRHGDETREREADAARRDTRWRTHVQHQAELVREEVEHLVKERLPAALSRGEIPGPLHGPDRLGEGVTDWFGRLLTEVAEAVDHREESQRLALVELASRVQTSAHRIQAAVTGLADRYPGDADLLETTMQVDHAATQQARHAQSLKVLCGEWPGQQWQKPLAMVDVVRAASGRIVAYKRIEVTGDPDVGVTPSVVEPLIHLLAELLANATEYSPPRTGVPVTVRTVQRGAVIEVDDGGLGMDEYRLAEAREIVSGSRLLGVGEVGEIPQTGFPVVGRFADRHGFQVDLGPSPYGGVRAVVLVPTGVLETLAPAGTTAPVPPVPQVPQVPQPSSAPDAFGTPSERTAPGDGLVADRPAIAHPAVSASAVSASAVSEPAVSEAAVSASTAPEIAAPEPGTTVPVDSRPAAPASAAAPPPEVSVPSARDATVQDAPASGASALPSRNGRRLPQRRSRRDEYAPAVEAAPTALTPPGTPEQAGDWMEQFFEGGRAVPTSDSVPYEGQDGSSSPTPDSPEGLT
ncbi:ATP-binding protein [Streptomyces sp. 35G-GA-8]|uniref:ATP-binding protein n=1 Tax=Streptomyces sp. 35G-GA-8 TaxID=2939434 RepID=UPI00201F9D7F|nr:ATP-binding protein [Streptomyces sp. 35G-GA-8]MCL7377847.1 sensor histidine kinase [Streptomyces sp. 35G-GA-8]